MKHSNNPSRLCVWNTPELKNPPSPKKICDMKFVRTENEKERVPLKPFPEVFHPSCHDCPGFVTGLLDRLSLHHTSSRLYQALRTCDVDFQSIIDHHFTPSFQFKDSFDLSSFVCQNVFENFVRDIIFTEEDSKTIELATQGQHTNQYWQQIRKYLLTASTFGRICKLRIGTNPTPLVSSIYYPKMFKTDATAHGVRYEAPAIKKYREKHAEECNCHVRVEKKGLVINPQWPFLGASVDGVVICEKCGTGLVEIKCPYGTKENTWRAKSVEECCSDRKFCCVWKDGKMILKHEHHYHYQVQGQLAILAMDWCDLFIYTSKTKDGEVQRICRDMAMWQRMACRLKKFYTWAFVRELFSSRIPRNVDLFVEKDKFVKYDDYILKT